MVTIPSMVPIQLQPFLTYMNFAPTNSYQTTLNVVRKVINVDELDKGNILCGRRPLGEDDPPWKATFSGNDLWWKTTFPGRQPFVEDDFGKRQPSVEDNLQ